MSERRAIVRITNKLLEEVLGLTNQGRVVQVLGSDPRKFHSYDFEVVIEAEDLPLLRKGAAYPYAELLKTEKGTKVRIC